MNTWSGMQFIRSMGIVLARCCAVLRKVYQLSPWYRSAYTKDEGRVSGRDGGAGVVNKRGFVRIPACLSIVGAGGRGADSGAAAGRGVLNTSSPLVVLVSGWTVSYHRVSWSLENRRRNGEALAPNLGGPLV